MTLFEEDLGGVTFPDVSLETLQDAASRCEERQRAVADAEEALDTARVELTESRRALGAVMQKAIAYARVYAGDDEALRGKIDAVAPPRRSTGRRAKRDKSAPKKPASSASAMKSAPIDVTEVAQAS